MTEYEIHTAGPIGPVMRSLLPDFTTTTIPADAVLTGTAVSTDELLRVIDLVTRRAALTEIWITRDQAH